MKRKAVEQILDSLFEATGKGIVYMHFGIWVKKKHPELFEEFLKSREKEEVRRR